MFKLSGICFKSRGTAKNHLPKNMLSTPLFYPILLVPESHAFSVLGVKDISRIRGCSEECFVQKNYRYRTFLYYLNNSIFPNWCIFCKSWLSFYADKIVNEYCIAKPFDIDYSAKGRSVCLTDIGGNPSIRRLSGASLRLPLQVIQSK